MSDSNIYIKQFNGINNILNSRKLKSGDLVDAINVDITNEGTVKSRPVWKNVKNLNNPKSLYSNVNFMLCVENNNLVKIDKNLNKEIIDDGYNGIETSFTKYNNQVIISNKNFIKRYKNNKIYNLTPEKYINDFNVSLVNGGNFPKGIYRVAIAYLHDDGLEGSTGIPFKINVEDNQSIILSNLNQSNDFNINSIRVYISKTNSNELYRYGDYDLDINNIEIHYNQIDFGKRLEAVNYETITNGEFVTSYNGLILTAKDNLLNISLPNQFFVDYKNYSGYLEFDSNITMLATLEGSEGCIYVSDEDNCYVLTGNISSLVRTKLDCLPAIKNTNCKSPISNELFFYTQRGQILAGTGGKIQNLTDDKFLPDSELMKGAGIVVLHDGRRKIINTFIKGDKSVAGFGDWAKIVD